MQLSIFGHARSPQKRARYAAVITLLLFASAKLLASATPPAPITVFAASSLTDSLQKVSAAFTATTGIPVRHSFAASSTLARQIENGARVDVLLSADEVWMDYLQARLLVDGRSRLTLLGNRLVLIQPAHASTPPTTPPAEISQAKDLERAIKALLDARGRLVLADTQAVPLGRYSRAALESLGLWQSLRSRLALADNARTALSLVARAESPLGIVYLTDALIEPRVSIVGILAADLHPPITYPAAATAQAQASTKKYLDFLRSEQASRLFRQSGFLTLPTSQSAATSTPAIP